MIVTFLELTIRNFLSYGNDTTKINLNFNKPTLIVGRNYDSVVEGQVDSNGAGKSTILNGLLLCLFDKNLSNVKKEKQINNINGKNMELTVTFKVDNTYYKVERYRKNKALGGDGVRIYKNTVEPVFNDEHDDTPDSVAAANAKIEEIIGIPYEMFIRIVVFSATHDPFLSLPSSHASAANQRDIIEELFGLTDLTKKAESLKLEISANKSEFKNLLEVDERQQAELARHIELIEDNKVRIQKWDSERLQRFSEVEKQLNELKQIDINLAKEGFEEVEKLSLELQKSSKNILTLEAELKNIRAQEIKFNNWEVATKNEIEELTSQLEELSKLDFVALKKARADIEAVKQEKRIIDSEYDAVSVEEGTLKRRLKDTESKITKAQQQIDHLKDNKCPYCLQAFADVKAKIKECQDSISALEIEKNEIESALKDNELRSEAIATKTIALEEKMDKLSKIKIPTSLDSMEKQFDGLEQRLTSLKSASNPYIQDEDAITPDDINGMLAKIYKKNEGIEKKIEMAKEFIHSSLKSMSDVKSLEVKIDSLKKRLDEIEHEENPFLSVAKSLEEVELEPRKIDKINTLDKLIKHQEFLLKLLTKKDSFIRKALLNKNIPLLNSRLRYYLDKVGLPHKVKFNEEMGVDISQFGAEYEYGQFSSGQKARVNICLAFAFRDVLQSRFAKINLNILDECLDTGLGAVGVSLVARMIKSIAIENKLSMFVMSHRDEISSMFDEKLEIELRNGFSTVVNND